MRFINKSACIRLKPIHALKARVYSASLHALLQELRMYMFMVYTCALSACIYYNFTCALTQRAHVQFLIKIILFEQYIHAQMNLYVKTCIILMYIKFIIHLFPYFFSFSFFPYYLLFFLLHFLHTKPDLPLTNPKNLMPFIFFFILVILRFSSSL